MDLILSESSSADSTFVVPLDFQTLCETLKQNFYKQSQNDLLTALFFIEFNDSLRSHEIFDFNWSSELETLLIIEIKALLNKDDLFAKINSDQFVIVKNLQSEENPETFANQILHIISEPFNIKEHLFYINASIGISLYPLDGDDINQLLNAAKNAMQKAKENGINYIEFTQHNVVKLSHANSLQLMRDLPAAIENGEIYFQYQPQYSLEQSSFTGAEILARWKHPILGNIPPDVFIALAERSGMIGPLTIKTLIDTTKVFQEIEEIGISDFSLSINISPAFLTMSSFLKTIEFIRAEYGLQDKRINFEITEETILANSKQLKKTLEELKNLGIDIELDDFGTGYTSLHHLAYLPLDTLKIDKSFITDIDKESKKQALFKAIVDMGQALDLKLIIEGVETDTEMHIIKKLSHATVQGYFYSKPLGLPELLKLLAL